LAAGCWAKKLAIARKKMIFLTQLAAASVPQARTTTPTA